MDLELEVVPPLVAAVARDLTRAELEETKPKGVSPPPIAKLRDTHHALARAIASGLKDVQVSALTGYSQSRISILKGDPTFAGLIAFYRDNLDEVYLDLHKRMADLSGSVLTELQERFEEDPDKFSLTFLHDFFKTLSDKTLGKPTRRNMLDSDAAAMPLTMDLSRLDPDERAQVRSMIERRLQIGSG